MLYKNKFINHTDPTYVCDETTNDVEWYVYGSASDGRVATVYPRFKVRDNDTYNDNFEDSPPSLEVAYNTEMISNTFTTNAESAGITGIETHRHLGEKRYEIKDHLGNVRAITSDIKNSNNYNDVVSSWNFLADIKSMSNYFPYGLKVKEGSWSASNYQFAYNGKQEEVFSKNFLNFGARVHSTEIGRFMSTDPKESMFSQQSPFVYAGNNPIQNTDKDGEAQYQANLTMNLTVASNGTKIFSFGIGTAIREGNVQIGYSINYNTYNNGLGTPNGKFETRVDFVQSMYLTLGSGNGKDFQDLNVFNRMTANTIKNHFNTFSVTKSVTYIMDVSHGQRNQSVGSIGGSLGNVSLYDYNDIGNGFYGYLFNPLSNTDHYWSNGVNISAKLSNNMTLSYHNEVLTGKAEDPNQKPSEGKYYKQTEFEKSYNNESNSFGLEGKSLNAKVSLEGSDYEWSQRLIHVGLEIPGIGLLKFKDLPDYNKTGAKSEVNVSGGASASVGTEGGTNESSDNP